MGIYAKIVNNLVTEVIVADSNFISTQSGTWVETKKDERIRANYAGICYTYDSSNDVFYGPRPYASWSLDSGYEWQPPTAYPNDGNTKSYSWNETNRQWEEVS